MAMRSCPVSHQSGDSCPAGRVGPRGCAFSGFQPNGGHVTYIQGDPAMLYQEERRTMNEMLLPEAPPKEVTQGLRHADNLNPTDDEVLAAALGAPARRVLMRAEQIGPRTGWKDGYLTSSHGFTPPDPSDAPVALRASAGRVWSDLCERMPGVVARGRMRESILALPLVYGTPEIIPDRALWAAMVCLGILASVYRYEERNDGAEGISVTPPPGSFTNITGDADDEEEETKGIPRNIAIPLRQIATRMGRPLPHLTQFDVSIYNYKIRDTTSVHPYVARRENMDLRWPVFNDMGEANFLLIMAEVHGTFQHGIEVVTRCQEAVMNQDKNALLQEMINLKDMIDQLPYVFHKISVNPNAGENFANPVEWGQRYAKFSAPLSKRVPALSGLALPLFLLMDAFIGRTDYKSFLGIEAVHLRRWLPMNIRAFIAAIENHYRVPEFIKTHGCSKLKGVLEGLIESYAGERGFMGTHRYKVYGFLEVVAKTGRTETNGNSGAGDDEGRPWEEVHRTLSEAMKERLDPYRGHIDVQPHEMRGSFEECRFLAPIVDRQVIDHDEIRSTGKVTFDLQGTGITFQPGDRLAVMPTNSRTEIRKVASILGLDDFKDALVPVEKGSEWARFAKHWDEVSKKPKGGLTVHDILRRGHLAPLTKEIVMAIHLALRASSSRVMEILQSEEWPVRGSVGDLLHSVVGEVPQPLWNRAFDPSNLAWLPKLIPLEVPRTYSISNYSSELLPSVIDLTVSRTESTRDGVFRSTGPADKFFGISSGFLNPRPGSKDFPAGEDAALIGLSRPINFQLPPSTTAPVLMFAGGSGIAPFRGFWQSRIANGIGRNVLFLGVQSREKFLYETELRSLVKEGSLELHTAFSRDRAGLVYNPMTRELIEKDMEPRYIDAAIIEQGRTISELIMSKAQGGQGGYMYICGSVAVYDTVMSGIRQAIYKYGQAATKETADSLLATAFAERRFMLDIFMSPKPMSNASPKIPLSQLAANTGHRKGSRMWIGVKGGVYDITDFLPIHPGGTLIVAASAGLDATKTFDDLAHSSNPEVSSLLSKYFVGHLQPKPDFRENATSHYNDMGESFRNKEMSQLYDMWESYLRACVESLTTLYFEANQIQEDTKIWFQGGLFNIGGVRKFYQFQSRLMQNGFSALFGAKLQELYLKLSFAAANSMAPGVRLPDIIGNITRAHLSPNSTKAMREISEIGQFVCNSSTTAQFHENGILAYARAATELDITFLEQIRDEAAAGMDAFNKIAAMEGTGSVKLPKLSMYLLSILERIAKRLDSFYSGLAAHSIYHPELERNPARTRWLSLRRKIYDGSFFVLSETLDMNEARQETFRPAGEPQKVEFGEVFARAQKRLQETPAAVLSPKTFESDAPRRLADQHTARAAPSAQAPSSFENSEQDSALKRMSAFINENLSAMNRLSRVPAGLDLAKAMSKYGGQARSKLEQISEPPVAEPPRGRKPVKEYEEPPKKKTESVKASTMYEMQAQQLEQQLQAEQKQQQYVEQPKKLSYDEQMEQYQKPVKSAKVTAPPSPSVYSPSSPPLSSTADMPPIPSMPAQLMNKVYSPRAVTADIVPDYELSQEPAPPTPPPVEEPRKRSYTRENDLPLRRAKSVVQTAITPPMSRAPSGDLPPLPGKSHHHAAKTSFTGQESISMAYSASPPSPPLEPPVPLAPKQIRLLRRDTLPASPRPGHRSRSSSPAPSEMIPDVNTMPGLPPMPPFDTGAPVEGPYGGYVERRPSTRERRDRSGSDRERGGGRERERDGLSRQPSQMQLRAMAVEADMMKQRALAAREAGKGNVF